MDAIFDTFKLRAEAVNAEVHRFPHKNEALEFILHYLRDAGVNDAPQAYAVWAQCPFLDGFDQKQLTAKLPGVIFNVNREVSALAKVASANSTGQLRTPERLYRTLQPSTGDSSPRSPDSHCVDSERSSCTRLAVGPDQDTPEQTNYISFITGPAAPLTSNACSPSACTAREAHHYLLRWAGSVN